MVCKHTLSMGAKGQGARGWGMEQPTPPPPTGQRERDNGQRATATNQPTATTKTAKVMQAYKLRQPPPIKKNQFLKIKIYFIFWWNPAPLIM